ncbi:fimbrial protein [Providencia rettgeri]|uniref:fimbrial protein n=1 Tax=Providencia rettgeri TaxID=587 RepID=UPI001BAD7BDE|nr:fimbrial protein [Providencia rettgeri]MBS0861597.1 fimbrial protein [Providencia rettgeri]MBS0875552.1 fimbrial protein [Providencia rettgeri]MBS0922653.1 fimbrial protein [Providencia rettgeri]
MKKILLATLITGVMSASALAADAGNGKVTFMGAIIDAPCSISPDSVDQTVELGQVSNMALADGGKSTPRTFEIALENCDVTNLTNGVSLTFTGAAATFDSNNKTLGIVGTGAGAGVQITSGSGEVVTLGTPTAFQQLQNGSNTLLLSAYLMGNGGGVATITPGDFSAVADFTLAYE